MPVAFAGAPAVFAAMLPVFFPVPAVFVALAGAFPPAWLGPDFPGLVFLQALSCFLFIRGCNRYFETFRQSLGIRVTSADRAVLCEALPMSAMEFLVGILPPKYPAQHPREKSKSQNREDAPVIVPMVTMKNGDRRDDSIVCFGYRGRRHASCHRRIIPSARHKSTVPIVRKTARGAHGYRVFGGSATGFGLNFA
jgi:hypothetical protein